MKCEITSLIESARSVYGRFPLSDDLSAGTVGAAVKSKKGNVYTGICIDTACGMGFCAEHAALADMLKNRETEIALVVAVNREEILAPCGRCREFMVQINPKNFAAKVILPGERLVTIEDLLPEHWLNKKEVEPIAGGDAAR